MRRATENETVVVGFRDHDRQTYAANAPIRDAGEFNICCFREDGSPTPEAGEFRVVLVDVRGSLLPRVKAFGEGAGALRRAIDLGLLDQLQAVRDHVEFSRRLTGIGLADLSDLEIGESRAVWPERHVPGRWTQSDDPAIVAARGVEACVLARVVEMGPPPASEAEVILHMMEHQTYDPGRVTAVKNGVIELVGVGLLEKDGDSLTATAAAVRSAELELGL